MYVLRACVFTTLAMDGWMDGWMDDTFNSNLVISSLLKDYNERFYIVMESSFRLEKIPLEAGLQPCFFFF